MTPSLESMLPFKYRIVSAYRRLHYRLAVSNQEHQRAVESANVFASDFMAYLDFPAVWGELGLDDLQKRVLFGLTGDAKTGQLYNRRAIGSYDGFPNLELIFSNNNIVSFLGETQSQPGSHNSFFVHYNVTKDLPISARFCGITNTETDIQLAEEVSFLFSSERITPKNIIELERKSVLKTTTVTTTQNRVLLDSHKTNAAYQYHLLGEIEWRREPRLLVYAHNSKTTRFTKASPEVAGEMAFSLS